MRVKQSLVVVLLLGVLCNRSFGVILFSIDAPQDELAARTWAVSRPELKPLHADYTNLIQTCLWPLKFSEMPKIFGPKLETFTNWWGSGTSGPGDHYGPSLNHRPIDLVLPVFAPTRMMVSGLHSIDPTKNKSHTDLYAVGDIGYVELYSHLDGEKVQTAVIYFRADFLFIPLKSSEDFPARLAWEENKFDALKAWFERHVVPVAESAKPVPNWTP